MMVNQSVGYGLYLDYIVESTETEKYRSIAISSLMIPMTRLPIIATNSSQIVLDKYEV